MMTGFNQAVWIFPHSSAMLATSILYVDPRRGCCDDQDIIKKMNFFCSAESWSAGDNLGRGLGPMTLVGSALDFSECEDVGG